MSGSSCLLTFVISFKAGIAYRIETIKLTFYLIGGIIIINLLLHEMYSQSLLKCAIVIFKSIHETRTLTRYNG